MVRPTASQISKLLNDVGIRHSFKGYAHITNFINDYFGNDNQTKVIKTWCLHEAARTGHTETSIEREMRHISDRVKANPTSKTLEIFGNKCRFACKTLLFGLCHYLELNGAED